MLKQAKLQLEGIKEILAIEEAGQRQEAAYSYPLETVVRSSWYSAGQSDKPSEYRIILCTGGPTMWITGELDYDGSAQTARLEGRDYGSPWAFQSSDAAILEFARLLYPRTQNC
jgi:hypothetical protein